MGSDAGDGDLEGVSTNSGVYHRLGVLSPLKLTLSPVERSLSPLKVTLSPLGGTLSPLSYLMGHNSI